MITVPSRIFARVWVRSCASCETLRSPVSHTVVNFKTLKDCVALDLEEAQEFKYRASLHVGGHLIVEEIERGMDGHTTVDLTDHELLAVDILDAWIQQAERVETISSELCDLRNQLSEDRA